MFLIRQAKPKDVPTLVKLARMVYFINLPPNEQIISDKISHSTRCFSRAAGEETAAGPARRRSPGDGPTGWAHIENESDLFMFSIEEVETAGVIGTSQVRAHQGGPGNPNWSMKLAEKKFFSPELGQGTTHTTATLYGDETGPTEIGGLILQPSHRGHKLRPGRFLSFVRFHFMGLHREVFAERVLAEMMGPVTGDGDSQFWDALGRKFIPVSFAEADRFCQFNRKFIEELFPREEIYITLFPLEIQNLVASVTRETVPARRLLESLGFRYRGFIDPFDGGPHLDAPTDEIPLVRATRRVELGKPLAAERCEHHAIVSRTRDDGDFRAVECAAQIGEKDIRIPAEFAALLGAGPGDEVGITPMAAPGAQGPLVPAGALRGARKKKAARRKVSA